MLEKDIKNKIKLKKCHGKVRKTIKSMLDLNQIKNHLLSTVLMMIYV